MIIDTTVKRIMRPDQPVWLTRLQNDMALLSAEEARKHWPGPSDLGGPYYNHRLEHVQQVERDALRLLDSLPGDEEILLAAVWLHDRYQPQYDGDLHADRASTWASEHLAELGFPAEKVKDVAYAIARHADPPGAIPEEAINARILWDADKLTKIGPLSVVTYMMSHPAFPEMRLTYTSLALHGLERLERSRKLVYDLYFEPSRQIALDRFIQQKTFYEALARDVEA